MICFAVLILGSNISRANPEVISKESGLPTQLYSSIGQPLTDIKTMELHQRRFIDAANNVAKLFSQFDQKVHEITLAAKAFSASPYNERIQSQLLYKARQMEQSQNIFNNQYSQLQATMEREFRSFIAASNHFMDKQNKIKK